MDWNTASSLLWLLAFGALFFFMMSKGGCGMHGGGHHKDGGAAGQGAHNDRSQDAPMSTSTRDPQSGDANHAAHRHHGC